MPLKYVEISGYTSISCVKRALANFIPFVCIVFRKKCISVINNRVY